MTDIRVPQLAFVEHVDLAKLELLLESHYLKAQTWISDATNKIVFLDVLDETQTPFAMVYEKGNIEIFPFSAFDTEKIKSMITFLLLVEKTTLTTKTYV